MSNILQLVLIVVKFLYDWWKKRQEELKSVKERTQSLQKKKADRVKLILDGQDDTLSRKDYLRNRLLYALLRERQLRKKISPSPTG